MKRSDLVTSVLTIALAIPLGAHAQPRFDAEPAERDPYAQPLFTTGAIVFLTSYGFSAGFAASSLDRDNRGLYVPIAGPWISLAAHNSCDGGCEDLTRDRVLLAVDGVVQAAGVAMMAASIIADHRERQRRRGTALAITPTSVGVVGRF